LQQDNHILLSAMRSSTEA